MPSNKREPGIQETQRRDASTKAKGAPDHLINVMAEILIGNDPSASCAPRFTESIYSAQLTVGWRHFVRGRIVKEWSQAKTTNQHGRLTPD